MSVDERLVRAEHRLQEQRELLPPLPRAALTLVLTVVVALDVLLKLTTMIVVPLAACLLVAPLLAQLNGGPAWLLMLLALGMTAGTVTTLLAGRVVRHGRTWVVERALAVVERSLSVDATHVGHASPFAVPVTGATSRVDDDGA